MSGEDMGRARGDYNLETNMTATSHSFGSSDRSGSVEARSNCWEPATCTGEQARSLRIGTESAILAPVIWKGNECRDPELRAANGVESVAAPPFTVVAGLVPDVQNLHRPATKDSKTTACPLLRPGLSPQSVVEPRQASRPDTYVPKGCSRRSTLLPEEPDARNQNPPGPVMRKIITLLSSTLLLACVPVLANPIVLYTDIESGPNTGGEDNQGTYLSIFGNGFGGSRGNSIVKINGAEVGAYRYWGPALNGRPDMQQISVQPGPGVSSGAIQVIVGGASSNTNRTFTVIDGSIYFLASDGSDSTGVIGDITKPFGSCEATYGRSDFGPGDTIVVRGGPYTEPGTNGIWCRLTNKDGTAGHPLTIMAYPGERPFLNTGNEGFRFYSTDSDGYIRYITISGFDVYNLGSSISAVSATSTAGIRLVNNETWGMRGDGGGTGMIAGHFYEAEILGNHVYDVGSTKLYHNIYINNHSQTPCGIRRSPGIGSTITPMAARSRTTTATTG
jgi:hypothetical protein